MRRRRDVVEGVIAHDQALVQLLKDRITALSTDAIVKTDLKEWLEEMAKRYDALAKTSHGLGLATYQGRAEAYRHVALYLDSPDEPGRG
jgi:hypothetical protein